MLIWLLTAVYTLLVGLYTAFCFVLWSLAEIFRFLPRYLLLERYTTKHKFLGRRAAAELGFAFSGPGQAIARHICSITQDADPMAASSGSFVSAAFFGKNKQRVVGFVPPIYAVYPKLQMLLLLLSPLKRIAKALRHAAPSPTRSSAYDSISTSRATPSPTAAKNSAASSSDAEPQSNAHLYWVGGRRPPPGSSGHTSVVLLLCPSMIHGGHLGHLATRYGALCEALSLYAASRRHQKNAAATATTTRPQPTQQQHPALTTPLLGRSIAGESGVFSSSFRDRRAANERWEPSRRMSRMFSSTADMFASSIINNPTTCGEGGVSVEALQNAEWFCACPQSATNDKAIDIDATLQHIIDRYGKPVEGSDDDVTTANRSNPGLLVFAIGYAEGANAIFDYSVSKGRESLLDGMICVSHGFCWEQHRTTVNRDRLVKLVSKVSIIADGMEEVTTSPQPSSPAPTENNGGIGEKRAEGEEPKSPSAAALLLSAQRCAAERLSQWAGGSSESEGVRVSRAFTRSPSNVNWDEIIFGDNYGPSPTTTERGALFSAASPTRSKLRQDGTGATTRSNTSSSETSAPPLTRRTSLDALPSANPAVVLAAEGGGAGGSGGVLPRRASFREPLAWGADKQDLRSTVQQRLSLQYRCANSADLLNEIYTPTLILHSKDDQVVPFAKLPREQFARNPHIFLCATRRGGHACFLDSIAAAIGSPSYRDDVGVIGATWLETLVCEFCASVSEHR